jgi:hypothetical protein
MWEGPGELAAPGQFPLRGGADRDPSRYDSRRRPTASSAMRTVRFFLSFLARAEVISTSAGDLNA